MVGIKEMARELGISIGTVDRALHGRAGINPATRARVLELAEAVGYRPNLAARQLKSKKKLALAVILPRQIASFFDAVRDGIREGASPFASSVDLHFRSHERLGEGDLALFEEAMADRTSGLIICPARPDDLQPLIHKATAAGIPVVCVASDAPESERLTAVITDPGTGGAMVGELLTRFLPPKSKCAVITGDLSTVDHREKVGGFRRALAEYGGGLELTAIAEAHDDEREGYQRTCAILREHPDLRGIYVSTANSLPVLAALRDAGQAGRIAVITTDLFDELAAFVRSGVVLATIYQRPMSQGMRAVQALYRYIAEGVHPPRQIRLAPHLVMRSNLDLLLRPRARENA
jgi:LacI family transcriptional regulator